MVKYKVNFIYANKSINEIFTNVLFKELKKYLNVTCQRRQEEVTPICIKGKRGKIDVT